MVERIKQLIADKQLTLSSLGTATGINATTLNHIINGREIKEKGKINQTPSTDVIVKILSAFPDIDPDWLIMGRGPMYKGSRARIAPELFADTAFEVPKMPIKPDSFPPASEKPQEIKIKPAEKAIETVQKQMLMPEEFSLSKNIDKIVIFFKNKTYVTLKPEE
jgi:transcriptional regulator with XRE-family HTH domain